jgi:hypothetical protein
LDSAPSLQETGAIAWRERPDMKPFDSLRALFQPGFPMPPVAVFLHGAGIFRIAELGTQFFCPALPVKQESRKGRDQNDHKSYD